MEGRSGKFARYELLAKLGQGAFGVVYRARQTSLQREVALKILEPDPDSSRAAQERFQREALLHCRLSHPNVVKILDAGFEGEHSYLAMELLEGSTLDELIGIKGTIAPRTAVEIAIALCAGMDYLHEQKVIHRDLKPSNIILHRKAEVKILDFGLSRSDLSSSITRPGAVVGSPAYVAPESFAGQGYSPASDAYAVGLITYKMLVGRTPFSTQTIDQHIREKLKVRPQPPAELVPDLDPAVSEAVMGLLEKRPEDRTPLREFRQKLEETLAPRRRSTRQASGKIPGPPEPVAPRRPRLEFALGGVTALLLIGVIWITSPRIPEVHPPAPPTASPARVEESLAEWLSRIQVGLAPPGTGADPYWIRLTMNLARATRAPLPSLNYLRLALFGKEHGSRRELLTAVATSARTALLPAVQKSLASSSSDLEERWRAYELVTALRLLDRALEVDGADAKWRLAQQARVPEFRLEYRTDPGETAGWLQVRTYLLGRPIGAMQKQIDLLESARQPEGGGERTDFVTGGEHVVAVLTEKAEGDIVPLPRPGPRDDVLELGLWLPKGNPTPLFPKDLLWIMLPGRAPMLVHAGELPNTSSPVFISLRLPAGTLGAGRPVKITVHREHLFRPEGPSEADIAIGVGWLRGLRSAQAAP